MNANRLQLIRDLLVSALEGGSNYWYQALDVKTLPPGTKFDDFRQGGRMQPRYPDGRENYFHWAELIPTTPGGSVTLIDAESNETHTLNLKKLQRGLRIMREKFPRHWADAVEETGDAITGDVFLQCALFGDIIYG